MGALLAWLALIGWQMGRGARAARPDELARAYLRLCRKLARVVPPRAAHQGPLEYAQRAAERATARCARAANFWPATRSCATDRGARRTATRREVSAFVRAVARLRVPPRTA